MDALAGDERWSVQPRERFDAFTWDEEAVVYVLATGTTHALSPAASAVLATLMEHPDEARSCRQWLSALESDVDPQDASSADEEEDLQALAVVLSELEHVGLVLRHSP